MEENNIKQVVMSSLFGFAVGDALGVPVEFCEREYLQDNPVKGLREYGTHNQPIGTWSDDTSLVIATMDSINSLNDINYDDIMKKYVEWYKNNEYSANGRIFDIGNGTKRALNKYCSGAKAVTSGTNDYHNNGNGSLMRILPIALYAYYHDYDEKMLVETIYYFSSLTHGHNLSMAGCKIYCDFIKELLLGNNSLQALQKIMNKNYEKYYDNYYEYNAILTGKIAGMTEKDIKSTGFVVDTLEASIWCVINSNNYKEAVLKAVNLGGDTDTIGAITGSIAGIMYGIDDIPEKWLSQLKRREYLEDMANSFAEVLTTNKSQKLNL